MTYRRDVDSTDSERVLVCLPLILLVPRSGRTFQVPKNFLYPRTHPRPGVRRRLGLRRQTFNSVFLFFKFLPVTNKISFKRVK